MAEAKRFIHLARTLLDRPQEEIVVNYLDHAVEALQIVAEIETDQSGNHPGEHAFNAPAMEQAEGRD